MERTHHNPSKLAATFRREGLDTRRRSISPPPARRPSDSYRPRYDSNNRPHGSSDRANIISPLLREPHHFMARSSARTRIPSYPYDNIQVRPREQSSRNLSRNYSSERNEIKSNSPGQPPPKPVQQIRANFNGIAGVPTGPKTLENARLNPHIFVSVLHVPVNESILQIFQAFLKWKNVLCDNAGYYINFEDSPAGHRRLDECYEACNMRMLLNTYMVKMERFHEGQRRSPNLAQQSSPLLSTRLDLDEASSIGGRTVSSNGSDRRPKCHVCRKASVSEVDSLIQCAACVRRYHRKCHTQPPIPGSLESGLWECRRCIKKQKDRFEGQEPRPKRARFDVSSPLGEIAFSTHSNLTKIKNQRREENAQANKRSVAARDELVSDPNTELVIEGETRHDSHNKPSLLPDLVPTERATSDALLLGQSATTKGVTPEFLLPIHHPEFDDLEDTIEKAFSTANAAMPPPTDQSTKRPLQLQRKKLQHSILSNSLQASEGSADRAEVAREDTQRTETAENTSEDPSIHRPVQEPVADHFEVPESPQDMRQQPIHKTLFIDAPAPGVEDDDGSGSKPPKAKRKERPMCPICNKKRIVHPHDKCWGCHKAIGVTATPKSLPQRVPSKSPEPDVEPALQPAQQHEQAVESPLVSESQITVPETAQPQSSVHNPPNTDLNVSSSVAIDIATGDSSTSDLSSGEDVMDPRIDQHVDERNRADDADRDEEDDEDDEDEEISDSDSSEETTARLTNRISHEDLAENDRKKRIRRKSQTNSDGTAQLPKGTYVALIGLALRAAENNRLQTKAIVEWIVANVREYSEPISKNTWSSRISAILSTHTGSKGKQLWTKEEWLNNESEAFGQGSWYRLNPAAKEKFEPWHETLRDRGAPQEPVMESDNSIESETELEIPSRVVKLRLEKKGQQATEYSNQGSSNDELARSSEHVRTPPRVANPQEVRTPLQGKLHQNLQTPEQIRSSQQVLSPNERAILQAQRRPHLQVIQAVAEPANHVAPDPMDIDDRNEEQEPSTERIQNQNGADLSLLGQPAMPSRKSMSISKTGIQPPMCTTKSLFEKWPEYDPANCFDREAKLAEIKARPTRKQLINKGPMYTRLGVKTLEPDHPRKAAQESAKQQNTGDKVFKTTPRGVRHKFLNMQAGSHGAVDTNDEGVRVCETLEEFFDLPENPIPIIHNGELAFRDGTLGKNGKLPRATVIYKTGPL